MLRKTWAFLELIRIRQWVKNSFVLAPIFFAFRFTWADVTAVLVAFAAFCLCASSVYILNDLVDAATDLQHPTKRHRPIPSGRVTRGSAFWLFVVLLAASLVVGWQIRPQVSVVLLVYAALMALYTVWLKHIVILDALCLSFGFVLRLLTGAVAAQITVSHWILICTFFISLFLAFGKRYAEAALLRDGSTRHRKVLEHYTIDFLNQLLGITAGMAVISYALYTIDPATIHQYGNDYMAYTLPVVTFAVFRYFYLIYNRQGGGDPTRVATQDLTIVASIVLWVALIGSFRLIH